MRKLILAAAIVASATLAGNAAYADVDQPATHTRTQSTVGWSNAEMQENGVISRQRTMQVQDAMREAPPAIIS